MIGGKTFYGIQFFISILGIHSNALRSDRSDRSERILDTANIVLSMKDFDEDNPDDLEIIKDFPGSYDVDRKLKEFHRFVKAIKATDRAKTNGGDLSKEPLASFSHPSFGTVLNKVVRENRKSKRRPSNHGTRKLREKRALTLTPSLFIIGNKSDLERQYEEFLQDCQTYNIAYKYTDEGKPEENVHDAVCKIIELNFPSNCINITGVGFDAIKCLVIDFKNGEISKEQLIDKASRILCVWIAIFLAIAIILWCAKGWCCCCCCCSFCFPNKTIRDIKKYLEENPPGLYRDKNGKVERYHATAKEKELYEILIKSVEQY